MVFLPDPITKVRAKARAERDLEWRAYIREMLEAMRKGEDFDKPSPDEKDSDNSRE